MSSITVAFGLFIVASASFTAQIVNLIRRAFGNSALLCLIGFLMVFLGAAFFIFMMKVEKNLLKRACILLFLAGGLSLAWQIKTPPEKIHIIEYGILGWLAARDFKMKGTSHALFFCMIVGFADEIFQAILPYRFFQIHDLIFNLLGAGWGIGLYILGPGINKTRASLGKSKT